MSLLKRLALLAWAGLWFLLLMETLLLDELTSAGVWRSRDVWPLVTGRVGIEPSTSRSSRCSGRSRREAEPPESELESSLSVWRAEGARLLRPGAVRKGGDVGGAGGITEPGGLFSLTLRPTFFSVILMTLAQFFLATCSAVAMRSRVFSYESSLAAICILWTRAPSLSSSPRPGPAPPGVCRMQSNDPCCKEASLSSDETLKPKLRVESCRRLGMCIVCKRHRKIRNVHRSHPLCRRIKQNIHIHKIDSWDSILIWHNIARNAKADHSFPLHMPFLYVTFNNSM